MLIDRPQVVEGTVIVNVTVPSGDTFPSGANVGELFYLTGANAGLYSYTGSDWKQGAEQTALDAHIADNTKHLTPAQNTLLDGTTVTAADLNSIPSVTARVGTVETNLAAHVADQSLHLTPAQNTLLDGLNLPTLTFAHLNYVAGATSNIQTQLNNIVTVNTQQTSDIAALQSSSSGGQTAIQNDLNAHKADDSRHLTSDQNTFMDGITVGYQDVNKLTGLNSFLGATALASYLANQNSAKLSINGSNSMTGILNFGGYRGSNAADPVSAQDIATKAYVDNRAPGTIGTPGTYKSVTTDQYGRVTAGTNPTTLAGYGITDAATTTDVANLTTTIGTKLAKSANLSDLASVPTARTNLGFAPGIAGQAYFVATDATNTVTPGFTLVHGKFVENASELAQAQAGTVDNAAVFNTWYRFSHDGSGVYPANSSETTSWSYNSTTNAISSTVNSNTHVGFVSPDYYDNYYHKVQLSSSNTDDDLVAVVIAFTISEGREYTLTAVRSNSRQANWTPMVDKKWAIVYNLGQSDAVLIADGDALLTVWNNNADGFTGWAQSSPVGTTVEITRAGNVISARASEMNSTSIVAGSLLTVNLTSNPLLAKFIPPSRIGYSAWSQADATFSSVTFTSTADAIYDIVNKQKYVYNGSTWVGSAATVQTDLGVGKFLLSTQNKRLYYVKNSAVITNVLGADNTTYVKRAGDTMTGTLFLKGGTGSGTLNMTGTSNPSYILMGNSDSGGAAGPVVLAVANRSFTLGVGDSFTGAGGTVTTRFFSDGVGNFGLNTNAPGSFGHGGNNFVLQLHNSNAVVNSQAHFIMTSGITTTTDSSLGSITWALPNVSSGGAGRLAHLGAVTAANHTTANPAGYLVFSTKEPTDSTAVARMFIKGGLITDAAGLELGFKDIPPIANTWVKGKANIIGAGATIPTASEGTVYHVYNNTATALPLASAAGLTVYLGGTGATGTRNLLPRGFATIWYQNATTAIINGNVT